MTRDDDILDYLLGEASPEIVAELEESADEDPLLAAELNGLGRVVATLESMPEGAWEDAEIPALPPLGLPAATGATSPGAAGGAADDRGGVVLPFRRPVALPRFAAVAASLALLATGFGAGALIFGGGGGSAGPAPAGPSVQLASFDEGGPDAAGEVRPLASEDGSLTLDVSGLDASRPGEIYSLWLIDPEENLLTLGSFLVPEEGATTVTVPLPVDLEDFWAVDVSIEQANGDPGHSGRSVLRGEIRPASA